MQMNKRKNCKLRRIQTVWVSIIVIDFINVRSQIEFGIEQRIMRTNNHQYYWFKYDLGQKYCAPQVRPDWGSNA